MRFVAWFALVGMMALGGCSNEGNSRASLTEHQRDSVIAASSLPGAVVVGKAMAASDSAAARAARMNDLSH